MKSKKVTVDMENTRLIQRLQKPTKPWIVGGKKIDNPFSFGGGYKNGGLSDEAMDLLRDIFSFDYMGAAEFEFGAVPQALQKMAKKSQTKELVAASIKIGADEVFYISPKDIEPEVLRRIKMLKTGKRDDTIYLKEFCGLKEYFEPSKYEKRTFGWLELDNGFMFFVDKDMWQKTSAIFGLETDIKTEVQNEVQA